MGPLRRPPSSPDGRWQRGVAIEGFYLADSADTAWAEWYRALAEAGLHPHRMLPRDLWRLEIDVVVADLSTPARLRGCGLLPPRPDRQRWSQYQAVGEKVRGDGWAGLVAPSAARPTGSIVCLFRQGDTIADVRPLPPPERVEQPPPPPRGMTT